jgi:hypothetical protein
VSGMYIWYINDNMAFLFEIKVILFIQKNGFVMRSIHCLIELYGHWRHSAVISKLESKDRLNVCRCSPRELQNRITLFFPIFWQHIKFPSGLGFNLLINASDICIGYR